MTYIYKSNYDKIGLALNNKKGKQDIHYTEFRIFWLKNKKQGAVEGKFLIPNYSLSYQAEKHETIFALVKK